MTEASRAQPEPLEPEPTGTAATADWEAFYASYRKPGYIEGFEITSKLGGGVFGLVFRARRQSIGKDYAIKFLRVDDTDIRRAVLTELEQVQYFAQIDHPNLVSIEDRGEVDGIPYLVMAYAGAETLQDRLPLEPHDAAGRDELVRLFLQASRGVAALHERSLVHFDLKPANIFLKGGVARVGDYGLSKLMTNSRGSLSMGRGTPYYMAPEMLQSRGDHRSDIYSLGVVLYEIVCGDVPFRGDNHWEVLKKHEDEELDFPAHVGERLRAVIRRCMAKDPANRFQSVHELVAVLGAPVGVGAAAWHETQNGPVGGAAKGDAGAGQRNASAAGSGPGGDDDPWQGFSKASREAYSHAGKIAREAMSRARAVAQQSSQEAGKIMRRAMAEARRKHGLRLEAYRRLWAQKRSRRRRERLMAHAERVAQRRARGAHGGRWVWAGVVGVMFAMAMFNALRQSRPASAPRAFSNVQQAQPLSADQDPVAILGSVPPALRGAVSVGEPVWVLHANEDLARARRELLEHQQRFEAFAEPAAPARPAADELPRFDGIRLSLPAHEYKRMHALLERLADAPEYDAETAQRLRPFLLAALLTAAQSLQSTATAEPEELQRARNLQRFLVEGTGYRGIPLCDDEELPGFERLRRNRDLGELWFWFLNEFAHSPRAWEVYRRLRGV